jgi:hypothetical protein
MTVVSQEVETFHSRRNGQAPLIAFGKSEKRKHMPAFYKVDMERRLDLSSGSGPLTLADAVAHQKKLLADPDFDSSFSQIADFTQFTRFDLSSNDIRQLAERTVSLESRRALIVPNDFAYGLGRMLQILRDIAGEQGIHVCRSLEEALDWVLSKSANL